MKLKIIFDFDHVLFSGEKLIHKIQKEFEKEGIKKDLFWETYEESKGGGRDYKPYIQIEILSKKFKFKKENLLSRFKKILKNAKTFLYSDTVPFLEKWQKKAELYLVSYGEEKFQGEKIENTDIKKYFKKVVITDEIEKVSPLREIIQGDEKAIFLEDNPLALKLTKKNFENLITIRVKRGEGRYKNLSSPKNLDFEIKNFSELEFHLKNILKKPKCLCLFSGGLDSLLVAKILKSANIETTFLTFRSLFFTEKQAKKYAKEVRIKLRVVDISKEFFEVLKKPKFGYGKGMNPCIDCKILMLKKAKEIMEKENYDFIATGEVVGERPFSQKFWAIRKIEKEAGLEGKILRSLSQKLLPKTIPQKYLWIKNEFLFDIHGRSRKPQMELAQKFGIKNYPQPSGGCILCDPTFSKKLKKLFSFSKKFEDVEFLMLEKTFWVNDILVAVPKTKKERERVSQLFKKGDLKISIKNTPFFAILRNFGKKEITKKEIEKIQKKMKHIFYHLVEKFEFEIS